MFFLTVKNQFCLRSLAIGILSTIITALPVEAAEKIYFIYGPLNLSLKVKSLETFAHEGIVDENLKFYMNLTGVDEQEKERFRSALTQRTEINPVQLSRFFNTGIGEDILSRFGQFLMIQGGTNGKYALRGALIQAAFEPQGLTLLNFLKKLPTNMQIDIEKSLALSQAVETVVEATREFSQEIAKLSAQEAQQSPSIDYSKLPDIRQLGPYGVQQKQIWTLTDERRNRSFYVDVYKPQRWRTNKTPVVIISHGLASRPEDYRRDAEHLASYGYVVVLPQHPGSDLKQIQELIQGYTREIFILREFIDRPLDITFLIDELERRNRVEFQGRLDLENVGVAGHSFGGYTALALAGATLNFDNLKAECDRPFSYLNTSLLLQCRALDLSQKTYQFRDKRVKAVIAGNPVNSSVFGQKGLSQIQIPVLIGAGSYDPATPIVFEQARSFPWLTVPQKYLLLIEGQAHVDFSQLDAGISDLIESVGKITLPSPQLISSYYHAISLAFFEVYITQNMEFLPYLDASYTAYLSQDREFKSYLISAESSDALNQYIERFRLAKVPKS